VGDGAGRPLLGTDPAEAMVRLSAERAPFYDEVAHLVIDVDDLEPDQVAEHILAAVGADMVIDEGAS
jgi:shikimate kinase